MLVWFHVNIIRQALPADQLSLMECFSLCYHENKTALLGVWLRKEPTNATMEFVKVYCSITTVTLLYNQIPSSRDLSTLSRISHSQFWPTIISSDWLLSVLTDYYQFWPTIISSDRLLSVHNRFQLKPVQSQKKSNWSWKKSKNRFVSVISLVFPFLGKCVTDSGSTFPTEGKKLNLVRL